MLGNCKFCALIDSTNVSSVPYELIVEAIMQIAVVVSSKQNAGILFINKHIVHLILNSTNTKQTY